MECPSPDCREELRDCLSKKVSRKGMIAITISIVTILLGTGATFGVYGLEALRSDRANVVERVNGTEDSIIKIEGELQLIKQTVEGNKKSLIEINKKMDEVYITPKELKKLIKEAVKAGSR